MIIDRYSENKIKQWWCYSISGWLSIVQWPFQEPKLEVPTIYKAYFLGLCKGISPQVVYIPGYKWD